MRRVFFNASVILRLSQLDPAVSQLEMNKINFILIPDGGCATESREKLSILNKTSVNCIKNKDNNCFWYALVNLVYANHDKIKISKREGKYKQISQKTYVAIVI